MPDYVHTLISIPPKSSVAGYGVSEREDGIHIAREYAGRRRSFVVQQFWRVVMG